MIITVIAIIKDFIVSKEINYVYMAPSQNRFVLPNLPIAVNLSKYEKHYASLLYLSLTLLI